MLVERELKLWTQKVLDVPADSFGGLPPCPYAKKAWKDKKVSIFESDDLSLVLEKQRLFDPQSDKLEIIVWYNIENMGVVEFNKWIDIHNKDYEQIWLMGFHPEASDDALTPEFEGIIDETYGLIFVQSLRYLVNASERLFTTDYYKRYPTKDINYVKERNKKCVV